LYIVDPKIKVKGPKIVEHHKYNGCIVAECAIGVD
jgi:hypothetical protein